MQLHLEGVTAKDALWVSFLTPLPGIVVAVLQVPGVPIRMLVNTTKKRPRPTTTHDLNNVIINLLEFREMVRNGGRS